METHSQITITTALYACGLLIFGYLIAKYISIHLNKIIAKHGSKHQAMLIQRISFYFLLILFIITALQQLGFNLTVLLGAAGVFTVALSFASQTAASNLISGIFLLFERPFKIGDVIQIKNFTGKVDSIDLLSTKIATFDNQLVRIPNEMLIKTEMVNLSYFPTRRADILVGIAYDNDLKQAEELLLALASQSEFSLKNPAAKTTVIKLSDSTITLKLSVWVNTENLSSIKNELQTQIKQRFLKIISISHSDE